MGSKDKARLLIAGAYCLIGLGCAPQARPARVTYDVPVTPIAELDPADLQGYVASDPEHTLYHIITFFADRSALSRFERDSDALRLVSAYTEEPQNSESFRRIAYAVKIQPLVSHPECSWVEVRWFLESRSFDSVDWRPEAQTEGYRPLWSKDLDTLLKDRECM